ncbi:GDP-mannose transporter into the lumen of the Golgi [Rhizophlyctis rosea]|uniref:GDP-mannose transporter n=1 Tax=Rhizophlyctis rosea TaxID=64517 RepID=A0AAD5S3B8_9FUNG|nr:GDP-mannose transporter into the lumen of the Golgi [Rhizophlyctis rosea]
MIYTGSKALQYLSIPLFTIFKNLTIILIAYAERTYFNGSIVTRLMLISFGMMVLSSIIAGWADIAAGKTMKAGAETVGLLVSYGWMVANCLTTAGFSLLMKGKGKEYGFKDFDMVFYNNLLSVPILLLLSVMFEGPEARRTYDYYFGVDQPAKLAATRSSEFTGLCIGILVSSVSSFAISYSTAWCVRVTSSTTYSMVGALNKLPIAIAGMLFFSDPVTFGGVAGVAIAFSAGLLYSHAKNTAPKAPPTSALPLHNTKSSEDQEALLERGAKDEK